MQALKEEINHFFITEPASEEEAVVVFDLDSTLITDESLEEVIFLALKDAGKSQIEINEAMESVKEATDAGMRDGMNLDETIPLRINLLKKYGVTITSEHFKQIADNCRGAIIEGVRENIDVLRSEFGERIRFLIVSGGPIECVEAVANELGIEEYRGNKIIVNEEGYFDAEQSVINNSKIMPIFDLLGDDINQDNLIMVGDGGTDFDVWYKSLAKRFVGNLAIAGKEKRPNIMNEKHLTNPYYNVSEEVNTVFEHIRNGVLEILNTPDDYPEDENRMRVKEGLLVAA